MEESIVSYERDNDMRAMICNIMFAREALKNNVAYRYMQEHPEDKCPWQIREEKEVQGDVIEIKQLGNSNEL